MRPAPPVVALAAGLVLAADLVVLATSAARPDPDRLASAPAVSASETAEPVETVSPTVSVAPPTATPTTPPPTLEQVGPVLTTQPAPVTTTAEPAVPPPAPPPSTSTRQFQGLYGPLPTDCISYGHACKYSDAAGYVTGGPVDVRAVGAGPGAVTVTWTTSEVKWQVPAVGVVVRVVREWESRRLMAEQRDPRLSGTLTLRDLPPGATVYVQVQELNSEGLSPGVITEVVVPAAPSPSPSASSTASATPTG